MEQNIITLEKALKECYLPAWKNQLSTEPTPLLGKIKKVTLEGNEIVATAPIGLSGGFGFGVEGGATPQAGNVNYECFKTYAKDQYVNICISEKAVQLANGKSGSMINALEREIEAGYETAKWNCGRSLYGNGTGILAKTSAQESAGVVVKVDDCKNVKEGLIVDFYNDAKSKVATLRIKDVNRVANSDGTYSVTLYEAHTSALPKGFITLQNSYGVEYTGLGAIFDDSITSIYGIEKATNNWLKPVVVDASDEGGISDGLITKTLRRAKNEKNSNIDTILCGDDAYDYYVDYLRSTNNRNEVATHEMVGGFQAITFKLGNRIVDIVNEQFVPKDEMWGVDTNALELHQFDWRFATLKGGDIFNLMPGTSVYRALLCNYGDLICTNPGGCVRIKGIKGE